MSNLSKTAFIGINGILYLSCPLLSDKAIRDRFCKCLDEVYKLHQLTTIAEALQTDKSYLSRMKKAKNPRIPAILIGRFCSIYRYSPHYILLGKGDRRGDAPDPAEAKDVYYLRIIEGLMGALIELKGSWSDATSELVDEAGKRKQ